MVGLASSASSMSTTIRNAWCANAAELVADLAHVEPAAEDERDVGVLEAKLPARSPMAARPAGEQRVVLPEQIARVPRRAHRHAERVDDAEERVVGARSRARRSRRGSPGAPPRCSRRKVSAAAARAASRSKRPQNAPGAWAAGATGGHGRRSAFALRIGRDRAAGGTCAVQRSAPARAGSKPASASGRPARLHVQRHVEPHRARPAVRRQPDRLLEVVPHRRGVDDRDRVLGDRRDEADDVRLLVAELPQRQARCSPRSCRSAPDRRR